MPRDETLRQAGKAATPEGGREYQVRIVCTPHGMCTTHPDVINADLLSFFKA